VLPFPKALPSKDFILHKFGTIDRQTWDYNTVIENYLKTSLQAPQQFLPEQVALEQKTTLTTDIQQVVQAIQQLLDHYTDEELDSLVLPHPLLGKLTIKEMFYLMTYHPSHHLHYTVKSLSQEC
jgi:hypothetical protein